MTIRSPLAALRLATPLLAVLAIAAPSDLLSQDRVRDVADGDGRVHGAPVMPVSESDLHPGQVQTINLHPRYHTVLEFPHQLVQVDAGDPDVFAAEIVGNKLQLKATRVARNETSMSVVLADADLTVVPFLVRADSTQPVVHVLRYTDPVARELNLATQRIADRLDSETSDRVNDLAEARLQQTLLNAGDPVPVNRRARAGTARDRMVVEIDNAQLVQTSGGTPRLYLRYEVQNRSIAPMEDLYFVVRVQSRERRWLFFRRTSTREVYDVQDRRESVVVPGGTAAKGLLIMDDIPLDANQSISVEAVAYGGQRRALVERVLTGR